MANFYQENIEFNKVADYMWTANFLTPEFCRFIISKCVNLDNWGTASDADEYNTQDIYLKQELPDIWRVINSGFMAAIAPRIRELMPCEIQEPYSIFVVKYSPDTQRSLALHRDESHVTGSIKLNDDYEGSDLVFPEQDYTTKDLGVGELLLWPASITHPHKAEPITKGTKYSIVIWTDYPPVDGEVDATTKRKTY